MGSTESSAINLLNQWRHIRANIYRNCKSGQQIQLFRAVVSQAHIVESVNVYEQRKNPSTRFVRVFQYTNNDGGCVILNSSFTIFCQKITLLDNLLLSCQEALHFLKEALLTLKTLFRRFGYCTITKQMLGFNCDRRVKVWINDNFGDNLIETGRMLDASQQDSILRHLIRILNDQTIDSKLYLQFENIAQKLTIAKCIDHLDSTKKRLLNPKLKQTKSQTCLVQKQLGSPIQVTNRHTHRRTQSLLSAFHTSSKPLETTLSTSNGTATTRRIQFYAPIRASKFELPPEQPPSKNQLHRHFRKPTYHFQQKPEVQVHRAPYQPIQEQRRRMSISQSQKSFQESILLKQLLQL